MVFCGFVPVAAGCSSFSLQRSRAFLQRHPGLGTSDTKKYLPLLGEARSSPIATPLSGRRRRRPNLLALPHYEGADGSGCFCVRTHTAIVQRRASSAGQGCVCLSNVTAWVEGPYENPGRRPKDRSVVWEAKNRWRMQSSDEGLASSVTFLGATRTRGKEANGAFQSLSKAKLNSITHSQSPRLAQLRDTTHICCGQSG